MQWTVVVPGALIPAPLAGAVIDAARSGQAGAAVVHLPGLLATAQIDAPRDTVPRFEGAAHLGLLWPRFGHAAQPPASAAGAWHALFGSAPPPHLWLADPVHFGFARDHFLVDALPDLADEEFAALADAAADSLRAAGARLHLAGTQGFIAFDTGWQLDAEPLACALGEPVQPRMPEGPDASRWRRLLSEIQMVWHEHPVNQAREARGAPPLNALWLHGAGQMGALRLDGLTEVVANDPALRGWALAAGLPPTQVHADLDRTPRGNALLLWPDLFAPCKAEAWGAWLPAFARFDAWLGRLATRAAAAGARIELLLAGRRQTRRVLITSTDRWKLWRRPGAAARLVPVFSESEPQSGARA